jgi:hypothetical protein
VETLNDNSLAGVMNAQEREENKQAVSNVITEKAHIESYNRFRELQKIYSQAFNYST